MALPKQQRPLTAEEKRIKHRVMTSKQHRSPLDRTSNYHERLGQLAKDCGLPVDEVIEEWSERAACREYMGGVTRDEAESLAYSDVVERFIF